MYAYVYIGTFYCIGKSIKSLMCKTVLSPLSPPVCPLNQDSWKICDTLQKKRKAPARGRGVEEDLPQESEKDLPEGSKGSDSQTLEEEGWECYTCDTAFKTEKELDKHQVCSTPDI
jgi:hypothetical protein